MGDSCTMNDLIIIGENVRVRDIDITLQKHLVNLKECRAAASGGEKDSLSNNSIEENASKDFHPVDFVNFTKAREADCESDGLRRRKRKQVNVNIRGASSKTANSEQTALNQDSKNVVEVQACPQELVEMEERNLEVGGAAIESLVCDSLQGLKRCKRKIGVSPIQEVGLDMSTVSDCALDDKLGMEFDAKDNFGSALGFKRTSCSIGEWKEREETGAGKDAREKGLSSACEEAVETSIAASSAPRNNLGLLMSLVLNDLGGTINAAPTDHPQSSGLVDKMRTSLHNDYENRGDVTASMKEVSRTDQTENQKLRAALAASKSQFNALLSLAEKGSRNCGYCQSIEEAIRKLLLNFGDISSGQVAEGKTAMCEQSLACEEAQEWSSPVGSCTSGRTGVSSDNCKRQKSSVLYTQQMEFTVPPKDEGFDVHVRNDLHEDLEEGECYICIDLASSQSEELDNEQMKEASQGVSLASERNTATEREHKSENLPMRMEKSNADVLTHGDVSSKFAKGTDDLDGVGDEGGCEDLTNNNSKEEGCWNSTLTRNSWGLQGGDVTNEAEDDGYIDLRCGCTSQKHGDTTGILRLYQNGKVEIQCQCSLGCMKGKPMSPASFERHGGRGASKKWKDTIWIVLGDQKVQFSKVKGLDAFVRRYKELGRGRLRQSAPTKLPYHRDEFVQCKKCSKRRRFRRKTKEECWLFHEASMNSEWECFNYPSDSVLGCEDDEEREARQANRGCVHSRSCEGCIECVCLGCFTCRFEECSCRLCVEYILNNK